MLGGHHRKRRENEYETHLILYFGGGETASFPPLYHSFRFGTAMGTRHPGHGLASGLGIMISYLLKAMPRDVGLRFHVLELSLCLRR